MAATGASNLLPPINVVTRLLVTYLCLIYPAKHAFIHLPITHISVHLPTIHTYTCLPTTHPFLYQLSVYVPIYGTYPSVYPLGHPSIHTFMHLPTTHTSMRPLLTYPPITYYYPSRVFRTEPPALLSEFSVHSLHYVRPPDLVSGDLPTLCQRNENLRKLHHHHLPPPTSKVSPSEDSRSLTFLGCYGDSPPGPRLASDLVIYISSVLVHWFTFIIPELWRQRQDGPWVL